MDFRQEPCIALTLAACPRRVIWTGAGSPFIKNSKACTVKAIRCSVVALSTHWIALGTRKVPKPTCFIEVPEITLAVKDHYGVRWTLTGIRTSQHAGSTGCAVICIVFTLTAGEIAKLTRDTYSVVHFESP